MTITRWGIIGPGSIAENFADGLAECDSGELFAISSRSEDNRAAVGDKRGIDPARRYADAADLVADPEVDAIYVSTPHPFHAEMALLAIRAGKPVLVEKPAGMNAAEVEAIADAARQEGVAFMEAFMYRCHPQIAKVDELITGGAIGQVTHIRASFGFDAAPNPDSRLYARKLGGGGILDVGGYPVSAAMHIAGVARGERYAEPVSVKGSGHIGETGVDEVAYGLLDFGEGLTAQVACAIHRNMENTVTIEGTEGTLVIDNPWVPGRNAGPSDSTLRIIKGDDVKVVEIKRPEHLFTFEAELASRTVADKLSEAPAPAVSPAESIAINNVLDQWRAEVGYTTFAEEPGVVRKLSGTMPKGLPQVSTVKVDGIDLPMNRMILGCDNRNTPAEGAVMWDAWMEVGGHTFDTAFVYGGGKHEAVLGQWIASRGVAKEINVIAKGAHSPYCTPRAIETQLEMSLNRLQLDSVPIYVMHRDNPDVPVDEFVDVLDRLKAAGKIGVWGGSNWTTARLAEAITRAEATGQAAPSILNNNLALAVMEKPVWDGCISSNSPETLEFLRSRNLMHLSWSSGARGYFLPPEIRGRLPEDTSPETCFGSDANAERRRRAEELADERGVTAHHVAMAWVLAQSFPSFALIGPRNPGQLASTLPALEIELSPQEAAWLNLEAESR
ncbi:aldo/keto reductase [Pelagovum pacificum]|uniref:Oxidoreductase n=1 Tax=Pelagovum pacificum TaxID=2588711 RepID=A0A5C5GDT8_9RHOB|nr:aldo/keto reductase [Pelagovum pacificum]QQA44013.1 aldo/keto reductase [Pelagovum pacificum]TNY32858.1 oxidoreductase [Pelagovum pacificum]